MVFQASHERKDSYHHVLLIATGSVASIKVPLIVRRLLTYEKVKVEVVATQSALNFVSVKEIEALGTRVWTDIGEWATWNKVGDPILHVELRRWADTVLVAPCSANTLAKIASGLCDNLATSVLRALAPSTPTFIVPAMNTHMYDHPLTARHLAIIQDAIGYTVVSPAGKALACGDVGMGAMSEWTDIVELVVSRRPLSSDKMESKPSSAVMAEQHRIDARANLETDVPRTIPGTHNPTSPTRTTNPPAPAQLDPSIHTPHIIYPAPAPPPSVVRSPQPPTPSIQTERVLAAYTGRVSPPPRATRVSPMGASGVRGREITKASLKKRACVACKQVKTRCDWSNPSGPCTRCKAQKKECVPVEIKPKLTTHTLASLKQQVLDKNDEIDRMLQQLKGRQHLFGSLSAIDEGELDGGKCDSPNPAAGAATGMSAIDLYKRARLMQLQNPDVSEDDSDVEESEMEGLNGGEKHRNPSLSLSLPSASPGTPVGTFFELSLSLGTPSSESTSKEPSPTAPNAPADVGLAGADYFAPGPATRPDIRRILIEREKLPAYLVQGTVEPEECIELFSLFMKYSNVSVGILDPELHTPKSVLARCPFLFTVVLAIAARDYHKRKLYPLLMQEAKKLRGFALLEWWKSVEIVQAFILLAMFPPPSRRWDEDRTWMYLGCAIRMATDLDLNRPAKLPFANEIAEREYLNRIRTWLLCHNLEVLAAAQLGKVTTIPEDRVIASSKTWWRSSKYNSTYDVHLCAFAQISLLFQKYHRVLALDTSAPEGYDTRVHVGGLAEQFTAEIQDLQAQFERIFAESSNPDDPACKYRAHVRYVAHYFRLVIYSICHRRTSPQGARPADPLLLLCLDAASQLVKALNDHYANSIYLKYSAECWFTFGAFAAAFMIKLLCPCRAPVIDDPQRQRLRSLVMQLIFTYSSAQVSIDQQHTPNIYARFLSRLLTRADELNKTGAATIEQQVAPSGSTELDMDQLFKIPSIQNLVS